jgi:hypothetical protein
MLLDASCHCGAVRFSVESDTPYPYMRCYCSICRKTAGGGGYAINIMGRAETLKIDGEEDISIYRVRDDDGAEGDCRRHFCRRCGSALWVSDPHWPDLMHPFASAVDTPLPTPPERANIMLDFAASWADVPTGDSEIPFAEYPAESIEAWHRARGIFGA